MKDLAGKTAVVTGAASGLGLAFANQFAKDGMNVVMSDIEQPRLDEAVAQVETHGTRVVGIITDVSDGDSMDALAAATFEAFESVNVLCNNAGVAGGLTTEGIDSANWKWVLDVNLFGVVHGHRVFLPHMVEHGDGHIVNTASMAGHFPGHSAYTASKWAVVGITMGLLNEMRQNDTGVGVSCLCPGWVDTQIANSDRNIPEWAAPAALVEPTEEQEFRMQFLKDVLAAGKTPESVAQMVRDAIVNDSFWIFTHPEMVDQLAAKHASIMENRNPEPFSLLD
ncbi:MAG: SDR family NAD(P)-dependent oxidoreductase [Actinobacteria bacterium]|nr:SDR family NAD(P)-dependent oxidoreductase [Actinomycetota bacterium]